MSLATAFFVFREKTGTHKKIQVTLSTGETQRLKKCRRGLAPRAHQGHTFGRRRQVSSSAKKPLQTIGRSMAFRSPRTRKKTAHGWVPRFVSYSQTLVMYSSMQCTTSRVSGPASVDVMRLTPFSHENCTDDHTGALARPGRSERRRIQWRGRDDSGLEGFPRPLRRRRPGQ